MLHSLALAVRPLGFHVPAGPPLQGGQPDAGGSILAWAGVGLILLIWWWLSRQPGPAGMTAGAMAPEPAVPAAPPDDLTLIEGIGPKVAALLQSTGISSFGQLAASDVNRLQGLLDEAGMPMIDPGTWPEQARLAAAGDWDAFHAMHEQLTAGRRM